MALHYTDKEKKTHKLAHNFTQFIAIVGLETKYILVDCMTRPFFCIKTPFL